MPAHRVEASPELISALVASVTEGLPLEAVARMHGMGRNRLASLRERHPELESAFKNAAARKARAATPTKVTKPKPVKVAAVEAERPWRETPDTRPWVPERAVASAVGAAIRAFREDLLRSGFAKANDSRPPRFDVPPSSPEFHKGYHLHSDAPRRALLGQTIWEEDQRMEHENALSWNRATG
jgi:hypothetical protein